MRSAVWQKAVQPLRKKKQLKVQTCTEYFPKSITVEVIRQQLFVLILLQLARWACKAQSSNLELSKQR
jgi:hypothetical protein